MTEDTAHLVSLLERVSAQLEALPALVAREVAGAVHGRARRLADADADSLAALVAALRHEVGEDVLFAVQDLADGGPMVLRAVERAVGPLPEAGKRLGKLFARAADVAVDGLAITRGSDAREGALWRLRRVCDFEPGFKGARVGTRSGAIEAKGIADET